MHNLYPGGVLYAYRVLERRLRTPPGANPARLLGLSRGGAALGRCDQSLLSSPSAVLVLSVLTISVDLVVFWRQMKMRPMIIMSTMTETVSAMPI